MARTIIHDDCLNWIKTQEVLQNVVTGICDQSETTMNIDEYLVFFNDVADEIFKKLAPKGYAIFIQTDRKYNKQVLSKAFMLMTIAYEHNVKLIWHKIVMHRPGTDLHRPSYAHMLCFSKSGTTGAATPDVIQPSKRVYKNGTPINAAIVALEFIKKYSDSNVVIDLFVGRGTIVAIANKMGLSAIGIDIDKEQVEAATKLIIS